MSKKLSFCLEAARLHDDDSSALTDRIEHYIGAGMSTEDAEAAAIDDVLRDVRNEREDFMKAVLAKYPAPASKTMAEAEAELARAGEGHEIVRTDKGLEVRRVADEDDADIMFRQREQPAGRKVPDAIDAVSNVEAAFEFAGGQSFSTNRNFKIALQARVLEAAKGAKVDLAEFSQATEQYLVRVATADARTALRTNANAVGWYNEKVTKALRLVSLIHPEVASDPQAKFAFTWALAVTSNGLKVDKNFELAEATYSAWKATGKMPTDIGIGTAAKAINRALGLYNTLLEKHGFETVERFMTTMAPAGTVEKFTGLKVSGENKTTEVYGAAALGPKIGNGFFMNLYGRFGQLTMDRWLMRTWGRWTGTLVQHNPGQVKVKRQQLKALVQALTPADKKAFERVIGRRLTVGDLDELGAAIWKASQKPENREAMAAIGKADDATHKLFNEILGEPTKDKVRIGVGDELRKVGNALVKYLDGQKEAPTTPERSNIRKVFGQVLAELQKDHPSLTMSDLQALLWYPEKRLYDAAKTADEATDGYEDDEAPDYANAAAKLARSQGVDDAAIRRTLAAVDGELQAADRAAGARRGQRDADDDVRLSQRGGAHQPFFSALEKGIESVKDKALSATGWTGAIRSLVNKGLAKEDEVEWSGLLEWLQLHQGKIPKEQVLEFLRDNGVQVDEVVHGGESDRDDVESMEATPRQRLNDLAVEADALGYSLDREIFDENAGTVVLRRRSDGSYWQHNGVFLKQIDDNGYPDTVPDESAEAYSPSEDIGVIARQMWEVGNELALVDMNANEEGTQYHDWTLPGGTNYREVLLTLPRPAARDAEIERLRAEHRKTEAASPESSALLRRISELESGGFNSNHWQGTPNVLAHIRVKDRVDADGKRVLFVEEIQSDWAQEGRKRGFREQDPSNPDDATVRRVLRLADDAAVDEDLRRQAVNVIKSGGRRDNPVARAPFVESTNAWVTLALKRVITMAVEGGYDSVAFTNGKQNVERYSLERHIGSIKWGAEAYPGLQGKVYVRIFSNKGKLIHSMTRGPELAEWVGEDLAAKINASDKGELTGLDLKSGGEGMTAFYDQILPAAANKLLVKLGGSKMAEIRMPRTTGATNEIDWDQVKDLAKAVAKREIDDEEFRRETGLTEDLISSTHLEDLAGADLSGRDTRRINAAVKTFVDTVKHRLAGSKAMRQPGFEVNDVMREKAAEGLPMFGQRAAGDGTTPTAQALRAHVAKITAGWANKPDVRVFGDVMDPQVPERVRRAAKRVIDNGGDIPSAVFYEGNQVLLFAARVPNLQAATIELWHEGLGHFGLRGFYGESLEKILRQLASVRAAEVTALIRKRGFKPHERLRAAEEILAGLAETRPELGFVRRTIAAIKAFLRRHGILAAENVTDDELIRDYILPARRWVERGDNAITPPLEANPAFSQRPGFTFDAAQSPLYKHRTPTEVHVPAPEVVDAALAKDATARRIVAKAAAPDEGEVVGVRLNVNVLKSTGVAVHSIHRGKKGEGYKQNKGLWGGEVINYEPVVTLKDAYFNVGQKARERIASGEGAKEPMASVDGFYHRMKHPSFDGVEFRFNPKREHLFRDGLGRVLRRADEVTLAGNSVFARGNIEYYGEEDVPARAGDAPTQGKLLEPGDDSGEPMFSQRGGLGLNDPREYVTQMMDTFKEFSDTPGKLNWWQKTIGTPYDLAQRQPMFKRVYDRVQAFMRDVSLYATEAADLAPQVLPKLDSWRDVFKTPLSAEDTNALQAPVFEGTLRWTRDEHGRPVTVEDLTARYAATTAEDKALLMRDMGLISNGQLATMQANQLGMFEAWANNLFERKVLQPGIVWTDDELRTQFSLTDKQVGLYKETRAAIDRSLVNLVKSDIVRFGGAKLEPIADQIMAANSLMEAAELARDYMLSLSPSGTPEADAEHDTANTIMAKGERGQELLNKGYAPLSRFGHYTVDVIDTDGERVYFGLYESRLDARRAAKKLAAEFPGATIHRGTTSQEAYKIFKGLTPETAELFGEMLGLEETGRTDADLAFQRFLKEARAGRSAMKRLIHRKGIAGFSEDVGRVLAGFVYSNSRQTAANLHGRGITKAVADIDPKEHGGELRDAAERLRQYVSEPREEAQGLRQMLFAQYLGGSLAAMFVNMTQPVAVTAPYLTQFTSVGRVASLMTGAMKDTWRDFPAGDPLGDALKLAAEKGIVAPQEVHQLLKQSSGKGSLKAGDGTLVGNALAKVSNLTEKALFAWGQPFAIAELFNRRVTFIAAYRLAVEKGMADPAGFAEKTINDTQFVYNKGNKPEWARGAVGSLLFTFKQYSISYIELLHRMYTTGGPEGKKAALLMLAMLMLMGGAGGLPFVEDISDLVDGIGQRLGYNIRSKHARQKFLENVLGETLGGIADKGITGIPGMPIDVSSRFGLGNLIPGTGLATKKNDHTRDVTEILGPGGDFVTRMFQGTNMLLDGRPAAGVLQAAPKAIGNLSKAWDMHTLGFYTDTRGRKVVDTDTSDVFAKAIGFQPNAVARVQEASRDANQMVQFAKMREAEIADKWAMGVFKGDAAATQSAKEELAAWNRKNPESPIEIKQSQIRRRVKEMRKSKAERLESTSPKEIREQVRKELKESQR